MYMYLQRVLFEVNPLKYNITQQKHISFWPH